MRAPFALEQVFNSWIDLAVLHHLLLSLFLDLPHLMRRYLVLADDDSDYGDCVLDGSLNHDRRGCLLESEGYADRD